MKISEPKTPYSTQLEEELESASHGSSLSPGHVNKSPSPEPTLGIRQGRRRASFGKCTECGAETNSTCTGAGTCAGVGVAATETPVALDKTDAPMHPSTAQRSLSEAAAIGRKGVGAGGHSGPTGSGQIAPNAEIMQSTENEGAQTHVLPTVAPGGVVEEPSEAAERFTMPVDSQAVLARLEGASGRSRGLEQSVDEESGEEDEEHLTPDQIGTYYIHTFHHFSHPLHAHTYICISIPSIPHADLMLQSCAGPCLSLHPF